MMDITLYNTLWNSVLDSFYRYFSRASALLYQIVKKNETKMFGFRINFCTVDRLAILGQTVSGQ